MKPRRVGILWQKWRDLTWKGPPPRWLTIWAVALVLGLGVLVGAGLLGLRQGLMDRGVQHRAEVEDHYEKGLAYLQAGQLGLARAELEKVLELDPDNGPARRQLQALESMLAPTPLPTEAPAPSPTPTANTRLLAVEALYAQAQEAIASHQWLTATALLDQLTLLAPDYQVEDVQELRYQAAYQRGLELVAERHLEEALRAFDEALAVRPDDTAAQEQRELAALYADALGAWGAGWSQAVQALQAIYQRQPNYQDVAQRLVEAQTAWGDQLAEAGDWCQAADHYAAALALQALPEVADKQAQANDFCANPPPAATTPPEVTPESDKTGAAGPQPEGSGHLAFAVRSPETGHWLVYSLPLQNGQQPTPLAEDASQPALSPTSRELAAHSQRGDQMGLLVFATDGSQRRRLTTFAEDSHPNWSADGQRIAFDSNREGDRRWRIYWTWAGGGDTVSLGLGRWPAWSPSEDIVAYQGCDETGSRCGLWLTSPDGTNRHQLTDVPSDAMPAWSPDGTKLAFASSDRDGVWNLYLLDLAAGQVSLLAASPSVDAHPVWSPDGSQVAFLSNRDGPWAIYVVEPASGQTAQVSVLPGEVPDWFEAQITWGP